MINILGITHESRRLNKQYNLGCSLEEEFKDRVDWKHISEHNTLSEDFIREFSDYVDWNWISRCQVLSEDLIREFSDRVDWIFIFRDKNLSDEFKKEFKEGYALYEQEKRWREGKEEPDDWLNKALYQK